MEWASQPLDWVVTLSIQKFDQKKEIVVLEEVLLQDVVDHNKKIVEHIETIPLTPTSYASRYLGRLLTDHMGNFVPAATAIAPNSKNAAFLTSYLHRSKC